MPVRIIEKTLLATVKSPLSSGFDMSQLISEDPDRSWRIKSGGYYGSDAEFHECAAVGCENYSE